MQVLDPIAPTGHEESMMAPRPELRPGARVGLLSNGKAGAATLLGVFYSRLQDEFPELGDALVSDKGHEAEGPSKAASPAQLDTLSSGAVAVLTASGD